VVMGHRKRTVHTPTLCMTGGGWEVLSQRYFDLPLPGRTVHAARQLMTREGNLVLMTYFFTDGDFSSPSLAHFQTVQLFERLRSSVPLGALVRTIVPVGKDQVAAEALADAFDIATIPGVLQSLRSVRLEIH
jgi:EpsI family protein